MTDKQSIPDRIEENLKAVETAQAIDDYWVSMGKEANAEKEQLSRMPEWKLSHRQDRILERIVDADQKASAPPRNRLRIRLLLAAALLLAALIATQASAIRAALGNYFLSWSEQSINLSPSVSPGTRYWDEPYIPIPSSIPDGFLLNEDETVHYIGFHELVYNNGAGEIIRYSVYSNTTILRQDAEQAEYEPIQINGQDGYYVIKNGRATFIWNNPPCQLEGPSDLKEQLLRMAESVNLPEIPADE